MADEGGAGVENTQEAVEAIHLNTEEEVERLLSEKLVDGFLLLEKACPACVTPLVKRDAEWPSPRFPQQPPGASSNFDSGKSYDNLTYGAGIDSVLYESPIQPIAGVPFCVSCQAHVVTNTEEVVILESADHLKVRGTIMVAMSRETLDEGDEETESTPWIDPTEAVAVRAAEPQPEVAIRDAPGANDNLPAEDAAADSTLLLSPQTSAVPGIENKGSKFSTKSILKSRSDHYSTTSGPTSAANVTPAAASFSRASHDPPLPPMLLNDDEDDDISLQEIEVVHLDDHTTTSEMERRVVGARNDSSNNHNESDGPTTTTTTERIVLTRPSTDLAGPLDVHREEETDVDTYHSSHFNNNQQVERNPMRSMMQYGGDSVANTSSVAVLRSDTSIPLYLTESRANTSVAALRGDLSFPATFRQGGDSPTNTSLAVLRGDPSMPVVGPAASEAQASYHLMKDGKFGGGVNVRTTPIPHLRSDMMEKANSQATPNVDESVSVLAVQGQDEQRGTVNTEHAGQVDRFRSLITHSEETPSPASFLQTARRTESIESSPASFGPKPLPKDLTGPQPPTPQNNKASVTQVSQRSVPVEALISYDERRSIATRVLGKKMIQGYSLTEHKCVKCQMPLMEKDRVFFCVVCPVLRQHYKKSTQQKEEEEKPIIHEGEATEPCLSARSRHSRSSKSLEIDGVQELPSTSRLMVDEAPHVSPAKVAAKQTHLTIDTALSKAPSIPGHKSPRTLAESSIHNEQKSNGACDPAAQQSPRSDVPSKGERASVSSGSRKAHLGEPLPPPPSIHKMNSTENLRSSEASRSRSRSRSKGMIVNPPAAAATKKSPVALRNETNENMVLLTPDLQEESHSSDLTSVAPNPPSTIVPEALDDESAKMSSITESYVSTFTNGTSRRSIREHEVKSRPSKPMLPVVKPVRPQQLDKGPEQPVRAASTSRSQSKVPVTVETVHSGSVSRSAAAASKVHSVRTTSVQETGACIEALEKYTSLVALPQLHNILEDRSSAAAKNVDTAIDTGLEAAALWEPLRDDQHSASQSRKSAIDSVIQKKTKRLEELKNARLAHEIAETESTGMLAEFNRMLQDEIRKEEDSVRHEIEVAEQHLVDAEEVERRINAKRSMEEIEASRLVAAEKSCMVAEVAMEKSRLAIELVSALSGADKNTDFPVNSPPPETPILGLTNELPMAAALSLSPTSQAGASPRHIANLQSNFDAKRALVTKEIGRRMMKGWNLIDASCPNCVMPLMTDKGNVDEICVLCGVVGAIPSVSVDRSVKTWTKGERVNAGRTSTDSKRASRSRKKMNSVSNVGASTSGNNRSSVDDPDERKRLKRELLREIIAETSVYMSNKDTRTDSHSSRRSQVSADRIERMLEPSPEKASKKERLRQLVQGETERATEKLSRHSHVRRNDSLTKPKIDSPKKAASARVEKSSESQAEKSLQIKADPTAVHEASPILSLHFLRRRDESSARADPPASVAGSIRTKTAVDADGASSWMEPTAASSPMSSGDVDEPATRMDQNVLDKAEAVLPPVVEVLSIDEAKDAPAESDVGLTLDTNIQLADHRMVHPSPGLTEATPPHTSSPAQSRFTTSSDSTNKATYRGVDNSERMTAPVPSPGISVAPEPELGHRHHIDTRGSAVLFPASMRPATSPGIDTIERGTLHEDDESYARIKVSRSAPVRSHLIPRRRHSPERVRYLDRKNKVTAIKPIYYDASVASDVRWDRPTSRYGEREDVRYGDSYLEIPPRSFDSRNSDIQPQASNLSASSSSRPRITPESIMRPRSTRSASSLESVEDANYYPQPSASDERKLRLANKVPSESMCMSIETSKAVISGLGSPHLMRAPRPPFHHHVVAQSASFSSATRRALLVQGELEQDNDPPGPLVVVVPATGSGVAENENDDEEPDRVLNSREVIVVEDGNNGPLDLSRWQQEVEVDNEDDGANSDDGDRGRGGSGGSVGSATLDAVLARIEETKRQLQTAPTVSEDGSVTIRDPSRSHEPPHKLRELIDNLAAAAEEIEKQDRLDMNICFS